MRLHIKYLDMYYMYRHMLIPTGLTWTIDIIDT